jgi:hypothetical protein
MYHRGRAFGYVLQLIPIVAFSALAVSAHAADSSPPEFSQPRGYHSQAIFLEILAEDGAEIRFTEDGSEPSVRRSSLYTNPIEIDSNTTIRAISVIDGEESEIATSTYLFAEDTINSSDMEVDIVARYLSELEPSLLSVPTIVLTVPEGVHRNDQHQMSMEYIEPDGGEQFQIDAGIKQFGATSLRDPKPNLRIYFKSEFGPTKLEYPLFEEFKTGEDAGIEPAEEFDQLELRQGSGDSVFRGSNRATILRNRLFNDIALTQGALVPHGRYVQVYINAEYFGVYHLRERFNAAFMEYYHGGDKEDYEAVNAGEAYDGDGSAWEDLVEAAEDSYETFREIVDVDAYLDHILLTFWSGMRDWTEFRQGKLFDKNWQASGPIAKDLSRRWRFYLHDADNGLDRQPDLYFDITDSRGPASTFYTLMLEGHPDFLTALSDRIAFNFTNDGPVTAEPVLERFENRADQLFLAIVADTARWGHCALFCRGRIADAWDRDEEWLAEVNRLKTEFFSERSNVVIEQFRSAGFYPLDMPVSAETDDGYLLSSPASNPGSEVWYTVDGSDPRLPGGHLSPSAILYLGESIDSDHIVSRIRESATWGPVMVIGGDGFIDVSSGAPLILNEWNAVDKDELLDDGDEQDPVFGPVEGNGGDWFELVVTASGTDLRGYRLVISEETFTQEVLVLADNDLWLNLPAGTIITISEDVATDTSLDPASGDWHINVQASNDGDGALITAANFPASSSDWQLEIRSPDGETVFGPSGEGRNPEKGVGKDEIGQLRDDPSPEIQALAAKYDDGSLSTFGSPNLWSGGSKSQNFQILRDPTGYDIQKPIWNSPGLELIVAETDSLLIWWSQAYDFNGVASYVITYQLPGENAVDLMVNDESLFTRIELISSLPEATFVDVSVQAIDAAGNRSTDGPTASFSTAASNLILSVNNADISVPIESFSIQDTGPGDAVVVDGASAISLSGNVWKKAEIDYAMTRDTILEFDFTAGNEGEVHAIGFETDDKATYSLALQLWGTARFGKQNHSDEYDDGGQNSIRYSIPVGKLLNPKHYRYLTFINDNDKAVTGVSSKFSNIRITTEGQEPPVLDTEPPVISGAIEISNIQANSADLSWSNAVDNDAVTAYEISLNNQIWGVVGEIAQTLTGLSPETFYAVSIIAIDRSGNRSTSSIGADFETGVVLEEPAGLAVNIFGNAADFEVNGFSNQDKAGTVTISADGNSLNLEGNRWTYVDVSDYDLSNSVFKFDFSSTSEGHVHAFALENNLSPSSSRTFKLYGTKRYGSDTYENYEIQDGVVSYSIPIDEHVNSSPRYLVFINDHDVVSPTANSFFSNIRIERIGIEN